ncbi:hypothetical protein GcM1_226027 [Golovinomyces cichoracearum]|uniref:Uncharacterized protein n=1 Tax=Golovinomyces cichoracearum TaxID=62708 RepID=A0A420IPN2_9PEZI|nr:hypothetical protein GcM1_226027 [Golovinomyces cichoracearum]
MTLWSLSLRESVRQYSAWASFSTPSMVAPVQGAFAKLDGMKQDLAGPQKTIFFTKDRDSSLIRNLITPIKVRMGDSNCFVQGFGSVRLAIKTDKGPRSIRIDDVQHFPGFHIYIFAYKALKKGGAYLDGRNNWIRKIRDNSCVAICENSPCESFLPQYAGDRPFQRVHIDLIHEEPGLSNKRYVFHFYCQKSKFNLAYVINDRKQKILVSCFTQAHGMIKKWSYDIQFVRMDQEAR